MHFAGAFMDPALGIHGVDVMTMGSSWNGGIWL